MTMMSVYSALREVKLLEKKISNVSVNTVMPAAVTTAGVDKVAVTNYTVMTVEDYMKEQTAKLQSYEDLKARLNRIKAAIAVANMQTIKVAGKEYTVFEALMLKSSEAVDSKRKYLGCLRNNYTKAVQMYATQLQKVEQEAYQASLQFLSGVGNIVPSASEVKSAVELNIPTDKIPDLAIMSYKKILEERKPVFHEIKPNFKEWLDKEEEDFERFLAEVDTAITEFNMNTQIEIAD